MAGDIGWSKNGIGKSRRSSSRASTPLRFFRCCSIHRAGFSENRPCRVLPTITEMTVMTRLPDLSNLRRATVDEQLGTIDEAAVFRRQEDHGPRYLVRSAEAAKRRRRDRLRREGLDLLGGHEGVVRRRHDG